MSGPVLVQCMDPEDPRTLSEMILGSLSGAKKPTPADTLNPGLNSIDPSISGGVPSNIDVVESVETDSTLVEKAKFSSVSTKSAHAIFTAEEEKLKNAQINRIVKAHLKPNVVDTAMANLECQKPSAARLIIINSISAQQAESTQELIVKTVNTAKDANYHLS